MVLVAEAVAGVVEALRLPLRDSCTGEREREGGDMSTGEGGKKQGTHGELDGRPVSQEESVVRSLGDQVGRVVTGGQDGGDGRLTRG